MASKHYISINHCFFFVDGLNDNVTNGFICELRYKLHESNYHVPTFLKITFEQCLKMRMGDEENNKFYYVIDTMNKQIENDLNLLPMKMFTDYRILPIYLKADIKKPFALIAIKGLKKTHKFEEYFWEQMLSMFNKRQDNLAHKRVRYYNKNTNAQASSDGYENELSGYMVAEMSKMRLKEDDRSTNEMGKNNALLGSKTDKCITIKIKNGIYGRDQIQIDPLIGKMTIK